MSVIKLPKKLRDAMSLLRQGDWDSGLPAMLAVPGFDAQKALVLAERAYFLNDWPAAMQHDEAALPHDQQWYSGNVLNEHLLAYVHAARASGQYERATAFLAQLLAGKQAAGLPAHLVTGFERFCQRLSAVLDGQAECELIWRTEGPTQEDWNRLLSENRPKLSAQSAAGADYLLNFMFEKAASEQALGYYQLYADELKNDRHHLNAARLYAQQGLVCELKQALLRYRAADSFAVEFMQVAPMQLWQYPELLPWLNAELGRALLGLERIAA